ncbi:Fe3+-citrate ABC transporter substrate-binding protein [Vibrio sp. NTOU-M3]|uniref:Fe3+-citrate ABC transporter substrate-binding protein n=1 Tax=Vibrio sp. NTOU-M3 TaxID=3234954 RepID=UPI00349F88BF
MDSVSYISKSKTAFKVYVPLPQGGYIHRTIGFILIGEKHALNKALKLRNQLGFTHWGVHWKRLLADPKLLLKLPRTLEPIVTYENGIETYRAMWTEYSSDGSRIRRCMKRSTDKHSRLSAYTQCKRKLESVYSEYHDLIRHMDRKNLVFVN